MLQTAGVRCLFRRGDQWPSVAGLALAGNNTCAGSYSDGTAGHDMAAPKPLIHAFRNTIASGTTWGAPTGNRYPLSLQVANPNSIVVTDGGAGGMKQNGTTLNPYPTGTYNYFGLDPNGHNIFKHATANYYICLHHSIGAWCLLLGTPYTGSSWNGQTGWFGSNTATTFSNCAFPNALDGTVTSTPNGYPVAAVAMANPTYNPAWIRNAARRFDAYAWMGTAAAMTAGGGQAAAVATAIAAVASTPYSWFYDPTTGNIHVNANGVNPGTINWEYSDSQSIQSHGANITGNGYVFAMRFDGWGCGPALGSSYNEYWGIVSTGGTGTSGVAEDCEAYYNGMHNIGSDGAGGGAFAAINCVGGLTNNTDAAGTSAFVGFSVAGGNETVLWNCTQRFGDLPWSGGPLAGWTAGSVFVTHGSAGTIAMALLWGTRTTAETCWANATWGSGFFGLNDPNLPGTAGSPATLTTWAVGSSYEVPSAPYCGNQSAATKAALINSKQRITLTSLGSVGAARIVWSNYGLSINESADIVDPDGGPTGTRLIVPVGQMVNGALRITCANPATVVQLDPDTGENGLPAGTITNCVFSAVGAAATSAITANVPAANCSYNAWSGFEDNRAGAEAGKITLNASVDPAAIPDGGSALYGAGTAGTAITNAIGGALEYDTNWNLRNLYAPAIGTIEGLAATNVDLSSVSTMIAALPTAAQLAAAVPTAAQIASAVAAPSLLQITSIVPTAQSIRAEMDANSAKLAAIQTGVGSISSTMPTAQELAQAINVPSAAAIAAAVAAPSADAIADAVKAIDVDSTGAQSVSAGKCLEVLLSRAIGDATYDPATAVNTLMGRDGTTPLASVTLSGSGNRQQSTINQ
jgi:hypothetical protein